MAKVVIKLIVVTRITNINNSLTMIRLVCESYLTSFLFRVGMSKLFCSFSVSFNFAFYGAIEFREGSDKIKDDTLGY